MELNKLEELNNIRNRFATYTLYGLFLEEDSAEKDVSELEDFIGLLEIHEAEVRRLRQGLSLHLRQYVLKSYLDDLKNRADVHM